MARSLEDAVKEALGAQLLEILKLQTTLDAEREARQAPPAPPADPA